jgi:hypothetical protein
MDVKKIYMAYIGLALALNCHRRRFMREKWRGSAKKYFQPCEVLSSLTPFLSLLSEEALSIFIAI